MCLYREINFMKVYLILSVVFASAYYSYAQEKHDNSLIKATIVQEIMNKVSKITLNSLSKVSDEKKAMVLDKIKQKLLKSSKGLRNGHKYVEFIMEEFKNKAFNNAEETEKESEENTKGDIVKESFKPRKEIMRSDIINLNQGTKPQTVKPKQFDNQTKQHIINDIANKIESMAKGYLRKSQTLDQKKNIIQKIKNRILESSKRKHMQIHNQHNELKAYADLITQGLKLSMNRLLKLRRMGDDTLASNTTLTETEEPNNTLDTDTHANNMEEINQYKIFFTEIWNETSIDPVCDDIVDEICLRIESLHKLSCDDGRVVFLEQLCDGVSDCWNEADEMNCTNKAAEKIRQALALLTDIDQSIFGKCLQPLFGGDIFTHHHEKLRNILEDQLLILQQYKSQEGRPQLTSVNQEYDVDTIKLSISEIRTTVSSLSYAYDLNLCSAHLDSIKKINFTRKSMDVAADEPTDLDAVDGQPKWSPKSCTCKHQFCKLDNCDSRCKHICWQKYNLSHWGCQSITGATSVSLDLVCDGKLDCFDETDETSCTTDSSVSKYEANNLYKSLLDILSLKSLSLEYENSRNKIIAQTSIVRQLQKLTTQTVVDVHAVKILRDEYFNLLSQIYVDLLQTSNLEEIDHVYEFLLILNKNIVAALKRSHTGNDNVVSPAGCFCNNGTCAIVRCSRKCIATCLIEPLLTQYSCNVNNVSVHIKAVCNGKKDCPNDEDEKDCMKGICRGHHLVLLRHNLQKAGISLKGTALGEVLEGWKAKVMSSLLIAKSNERPNHKTLEKIVISILRDLVSTYAVMEETKRLSSKIVVKEFKNMSDIVKQSLKSCGN